MYYIYTYKLTRTYPSKWSHRRFVKCFAITEDCARIANSDYGIPKSKIKLLPLGTDTETFHPHNEGCEETRRLNRREQLDIDNQEILVVYTGRFSTDKNPLILAEAISELRNRGLPYNGLFIGDGEQKTKIEGHLGCKTPNFVPHQELADIYRSADIADWPEQESMSLLDAIASGLPIIANHRMGDQERINGNGLCFEAGNIESLIDALVSPQKDDKKRELGLKDRQKMKEKFSWSKHAAIRESSYKKALIAIAYRHSQTFITKENKRSRTISSLKLGKSKRYTYSPSPGI